NRSYLGLNARPRGRLEDDEREATPSQILLIAQVLIGRDQNFKPCTLGGVEQGAIRQGRPSLLICGRNTVSDKLSSQWNRRSLIEQDCRETQKLPDWYVRILLQGGLHEDHDTYTGANHQDHRAGREG